MDYRSAIKQLQGHRQEIAKIRQRMRAIQSAIEPVVVKDYAFIQSSGEAAQLSELFGEHDDLIVVHSMGKRCSYCTLWADGLNGVRGHLENRAGFVVSSPDAPAVQAEFAASRDWGFAMVSTKGTSFTEDMGYQTGDSYLPGVSVFRRHGEQIVRVSDAYFGPGDDFCAVWHLLDLFPAGADGWQPRYSY